MGNKAQFGTLLLGVVRSVSRLEREQVCCGELTFQQFDTLKRIATGDKPTLGSVAAELGIDLSTASRNLTRLERAGFVSKVRDEGDARSVIIRLTRKGKTALSTMSCDERDAFTAIYDRLPTEQRGPVIECLSLLSEALEGNSPLDAECCPPPAKQRPGRVKSAS